MMNFNKHIANRKATPQSQPIPGTNQQKNDGGGFSYVISDIDKLKRFLIIGTEGGNFAHSEHALTADSVKCLQNCLNSDWKTAVDIIVDTSVRGLAPKNDQAVFALSVAASHNNNEARQYALSKVNEVCRIGTHLFQFTENALAQRGWGRGLRKAIQNWYSEKDANKLSYQVTKYQQRNNWSHKDLMRLAHCRFDSSHKIVEDWVVRGICPETSEIAPFCWAFEQVKKTFSEAKILQLITDYKLPHELIPTQWLNSVAVWDAMLPHMPLTAMIRNLGKMTSIGLIKPFSNASKLIAEKLTGEDLQRSRVHPLFILNALMTYKQGHGDKGSLNWQPDSKVISHLDRSFYESFKFVEPTGLNWMINLDVSGSMSCGQAGGTKLTPCQVGAALAMLVVRTEPNSYIYGFGHQLRDLGITENDTLESACRKAQDNAFGSTNCAAPMEKALANRWDVDVFMVITDNDTNSGNIHPSQALRQFRNKMNKPKAKLIVNATSVSSFSIADPNDSCMLDICGFSTDTPQVMKAFALM